MKTGKLLLGLTLTLLFIGIFSYLLQHTLQRQKNREIACKDHCNVILIVEDALAAQHLKTYGYDRDTLPQTTAFFEQQGFIFEQDTAAAPWTLPSFISMYYSELATDVTYKELEPGKRANLQSLLREAGVKLRGVLPFKMIFIYEAIEKPFTDAEVARPADSAIFPTGTDALQKLVAGKQKFFLELHSIGIHDPYKPLSPYDEAFATATQYPQVTMQDLIGENAQKVHSTSTTRTFALRYDQGILQEDTAIAAFLNSIPPEVLANTVIIFTADHGEAFNEHGAYWHAESLYQEELHVPLMMRVPGMKGGRISEPVSGLDIAPTVLALMGVEGPEHVRGMSLIPLLYGKSLGARTIPFVNGFPSYLHLTPGTAPQPMHLSQTGVEGTDKPIIELSQRGVRQGDLKLSTNPSGNLQAFNLAADPGEQKPIALSEHIIPKELLTAFLEAFYSGNTVRQN